MTFYDAYALWMWFSAWAFQLLFWVVLPACIICKYRKLKGFPNWFRGRA